MRRLILSLLLLFTVGAVAAQVATPVTAKAAPVQPLRGTVTSAATGELKDTVNQIEELVVIGYGVVRKSDLTGAVGTIKGDDVAESRMISIDQALSGKLAGVNIITNSGEPGAALNIQIRGMGTVNAGAQPLYVIDGAPVESDAGLDVANIQGVTGGRLDPLSTINPQDIKSIQILKDASATAIYGSRGANGVVLIETKSGSEGKAKVSFSAYTGVSYVSKKIPVLNGYDYMDYMVNDRTAGNADFVNNQDQILSSPMYNWQDKILKPAWRQDYSLGVTGGTKQTTYSMSAGYTNQDGVVDKSNYERFTIRARLDQNIGKRAKAGVNMMYAKFTQTGITSEGTKDAGADVFQQMLSFRPANVGYLASDTDGSDDGTGNNQTNPVDYIKYASLKTNNNRLMANTYAQYSFTNDLLLKVSYNYGTTSTDSRVFFPRQIGAGRSYNGRAKWGQADRNNWSWENILTWNHTFSRVHKLSAMVGYTRESYYIHNFSIEAHGFPDTYAAMPEINLGTANVILSPDESVLPRQMESYLGRVNYSSREKYLVTASLRADGSSVFTKGHKFGYFPSAALAWRVSQEGFMKDVRPVSDLKLRLSYGRTGNQNMPPYSSQAIYQSVYYSTNKTGGLSPTATLMPGAALTSMASEVTTWETTDQFNAGVDVGLFKGRVSFTADAYRRYTYDMLMRKPLPTYTGYNFTWANAGSMTNTGLELTLNTTNISNRNFRWQSALNISFNRNRVNNLGGDAMQTFGVNSINECFVLAGGQSVGTMYGYRATGVYSYADYKNFYVDGDPSKGMVPTSEFNRIYRRIWVDGTEAPALIDGVPTYLGSVPQIGSPKYADVSGDGDVTADKDRTFIGRSDPKFFGGFTNTFTYRGFDLNIFMQFSYGNQMFVGNYYALGGYNNRNMLKWIYDNAWRPYRDSQAWPDYMIDSYKTQSSTLWIEDGSYLKIKNVTLGYTLPTKLLRNTGISNLRVYASGQNLLTFTKFKWYDPESSYYDPVMAGYYKYKFPSSTTFLLGLNLNF